MSISVAWHTEHANILCVYYEKEWQWSDFHQAMMIVHQLASGHSAAVLEVLPPGMRLPPDGFYEEMRRTIQKLEQDSAIQKVAFVVPDEQLKALYHELIEHTAHNHERFFVDCRDGAALDYLLS